MSDSSKRTQDLVELSVSTTRKPTRRTEGGQRSHLQKENLKSRRNACNAIIARNLPKAGAVGDDFSQVVTVYENMVQEIATEYFEGQPNNNDVPTHDVISPYYLVLESIQVLVKTLPFLGPLNAMIWTFYIGRVAIDFYEKQVTFDQIGERTKSLIGKHKSKASSKERSLQMSAHSDNDSIIKRTFEENIRSVAQQLRLPEPDTKDLARDALLALDTFLRARAPVITVTGITFTGKSALINKLFGEKKVEEGLIADTTDRVVMIRFRSGLLIYDTPGAGGLKVKLENVTRAFLGLKQLEKDVNWQELEPIELIPTIDAHNYNKATGQPVMLKKHNEFEASDLYIFVVNIEAGTLQRYDLFFFREVVELGKPVIVVINKIDLVGQENVKESIKFIRENLDLEPIAISATTGQNIQELVSTIVTSLPLECRTVLGETVNKEYQKIVRYQEIGLHSFVTAVKVAQLVGVKGKDNARQMILLVLGLYGWIVKRYDLTVTDSKLKEVGASFSDLLSLIDEKLGEAQNFQSRVGLSALLGSVVGIAIAGVVAGGVGAAVPVIIAAIGGGVLGGGSSGALIGTLTDFFKRRSAQDISAEAQSLKQFISEGSRHETVASVFAFGVSVRECCDMVEQGKTSANFLQIYQREYALAYARLNPFSEKLGKKHFDEEFLIRECSQILLQK
jgi:ribosome biogenesis GTPase A